MVLKDKQLKKVSIFNQLNYTLPVSHHIISKARTGWTAPQNYELRFQTMKLPVYECTNYIKSVQICIMVYFILEKVQNLKKTKKIQSKQTKVEMDIF